MEDSELISLIGTEVDDGYLVRDQDCQQLERELKYLLACVRRVRGKRLVIADGRIVTAYHVVKKQQRRLLRNASERDLYE
jgi:hypothetical protein